MKVFSLSTAIFSAFLASSGRASGAAASIIEHGEKPKSHLRQNPLVNLNDLIAKSDSDARLILHHGQMAFYRRGRSNWVGPRCDYWRDQLETRWMLWKIWDHIFVLLRSLSRRHQIVVEYLYYEANETRCCICSWWVHLMLLSVSKWYKDDKSF